MKQINPKEIKLENTSIAWFPGKDRVTFVCKDEPTQMKVFLEVSGKCGYIHSGDTAYLTVETKAPNCVKRIQKMLNKPKVIHVF